MSEASPGMSREEYRDGLNEGRHRAAITPPRLNTDDPGWFDTDLNTELALASAHLGVSETDHLALQHDAAAASFAPDDVKRRISDELGDVTIAG